MPTPLADMSPAELLDRNLVLTPFQIAYVLGITHQRGEHKGQPNRRAALELIKSGQLRLIDRTQPITRWTVSTNEVRRYLAGEPQRPVA